MPSTSSTTWFPWERTMRNRRAAIGLGLIFSLSSGLAASGEAPGWLPETHPDAKYLIDMERRWVNSGCTGEDADPVILAPGFLGTAPDGRRFKSSAEFDLDSSVHEKDCRLEGAKVRLFRPDVAVVYGSERTTRISKSGKESVRCLVWTDTWVKYDSTWKIVAAQDNVVPCK